MNDREAAARYETIVNRGHSRSEAGVKTRNSKRMIECSDAFQEEIIDIVATND